MVKDMAGSEVKVGDYVVYGVLLGRCAGLSYGRVLGFKTSKRDYPEREVTSVRVQGVQWSFGKLERKSPGSLQFPETRMLKLTRSNVPENVRTLLDKEG